MAPLELELAFLYLFSRRGRGHRSRLVRVTAIGLAFGAAALVLTLALLSGFQQAIRREIRAASPGFLAVRKDGEESPGPSRWPRDWPDSTAWPGPSRADGERPGS